MTDIVTLWLQRAAQLRSDADSSWILAMTYGRSRTSRHESTALWLSGADLGALLLPFWQRLLDSNFAPLYETGTWLVADVGTFLDGFRSTAAAAIDFFSCGQYKREDIAAFLSDNNLTRVKSYHPDWRLHRQFAYLVAQAIVNMSLVTSTLKVWHQRAVAERHGDIEHEAKASDSQYWIIRSLDPSNADLYEDWMNKALPDSKVISERVPLWRAHLDEKSNNFDFLKGDKANSKWVMRYGRSASKSVKNAISTAIFFLISDYTSSSEFENWLETVYLSENSIKTRLEMVPKLNLTQYEVIASRIADLLNDWWANYIVGQGDDFIHRLTDIPHKQQQQDVVSIDAEEEKIEIESRQDEVVADFAQAVQTDQPSLMAAAGKALSEFVTSKIVGASGSAMFGVKDFGVGISQGVKEGVSKSISKIMEERSKPVSSLSSPQSGDATLILVSLLLATTL